MGFFFQTGWISEINLLKENNNEQTKQKDFQIKYEGEQNVISKVKTRRSLTFVQIKMVRMTTRADEIKKIQQWNKIDTSRRTFLL